MKQKISVKAALFGDNPAFSRYVFDCGRMLYRDEKI
jgi:hypothetical protein